MGVFKVKPGEHKIIDTSFALFLRRKFNDPMLFTGYNTMTKRWFLGLWVNKPAGFASDIEDLGPNMENATRQLVDAMDRWRDGITPEDARKNIMRTQQAKDAMELEWHTEFQEMQNWVQKKSGSDLPVLIGNF